ncbi:lytic transglycosylase domain-containing protein [Rubellimicrobium rubrum]|uniref:Lytic transglycosylase domain-containing protein n=1 Tax=Rubellimicrobium rubrum TaxID=2585369 RepID=A0A5C4MR47_9RHOB|nr:lytic transglycosylase domain-containing protein [Rubellimicrobium rubrum]TNC47837.1 lytic transglycosylase domain-containing protein [Rubellimicrobium rubrum]
MVKPRRDRVHGSAQPKPRIVLALGWPVLVLATALAACATGPVQAEDFTFRRVGVPSSGSAKRITVQIDPAAPMFVSNRPATPFVPLSPAAMGPEGGDGSAARAAGVEWFWKGVSPLLAESGPGRLDQALRVMAAAPDGAITEPRLQTVQDIARLYGTDILRETVGKRVSPALVLAVIAVESAGRPQAVSHAGAAGLMQLMPATAARFGVQDRLLAADSIRGGVAYLDWLMNRFGGDPILTLAAYNAGEGAVDASGGVPPYAETRAYVPKVLAAWSVARGLCQTPPELASDGCVFMTEAL